MTDITDIRENYRVSNETCLNCRFSRMVDSQKRMDFRVLVCDLDNDFDGMNEIGEEDEYKNWVKEHEVEEHAVCDSYEDGQ